MYTENRFVWPYNRDVEQAVDDKSRHLLIAIYCSWTSSSAQPSRIVDSCSDRPAHHALPTEISKFKRLLWANWWAQKRWLIDQNEANKQQFLFIRWSDHLRDWAPHSMTRTVKIGQHWLLNGLFRKIFFDYKKKLIQYSKSAYQTTTEKNVGSKTLKQKLKNGVTQLHMNGHHYLPDGKLRGCPGILLPQSAYNFDFFKQIFTFLATWGRTFIITALMFQPDFSLSC